MSAQVPLTLTHVSAPAAGHPIRPGLLPRTFDAVVWSVVAIRNAVFPPRPHRSRRHELPWDFGMDYLAEQASPPWIPRG